MSSKPNKTKAEPASVDAFVDAVPDAVKREDARTLIALMERLTGDAPTMWGPTMVGFGTYHYRYDSGREGDAFRIGFSPRSTSLVLYLASDYEGHDELLARLGKHKTGVSCLYVKKLSDVDMGVVEEMVVRSIAYMDAKYPR